MHVLPSDNRHFSSLPSPVFVPTNFCDNLTKSQKEAFRILSSKGNVFLSGAAGTGKSTLIRDYLRCCDPDTTVVTASTGAAAMIIGGRTFHSFFGLGILQGGAKATISRAIKNPYVQKRIAECEVLVIDEISMLSGEILAAAEVIARSVLENGLPWGGIKVIAVGDFHQLPPVNKDGGSMDWAFRHKVWNQSEFEAALLNEIVRTSDPHFLEVLGDIRSGSMSERSVEFLNSRSEKAPVHFEGTRIFPKKDQVEAYNALRLRSLEGRLFKFETNFRGDSKFFDALKRDIPIPDTLKIKIGALVMVRRNDPNQYYFNGSLGNVVDIAEDEIEVKLLSGNSIKLGKIDFSYLNSDGDVVAAAVNFPLTLGWATTIHKAQGCTLDRVVISLDNLWAPGQAYVALSRVRCPEGLFVENWDRTAVKIDPPVINFYKELESSHWETSTFLQ